MKNTKHFKRKIYTPSLLGEDIIYLAGNLPGIIRALKNKKIGRAFMEKIMTVVTAVNGCSYCTWFHAKQAAASGISQEEIQNMLKLQFEADAAAYEIPALLYAQHYAETNRKPDQDMTDRLFDYYGKETAEHIILFIRMIYFGNLQGNTFDAFLSRLNGVKAEDSSVLFEFVFFACNAPIMLPLLPFTKKYR